MIKRFRFEFFGFYKYDSECWGVNLLSFGVMDKSLFGFNSDEDGWYLELFWLIDCKIRDTRKQY